MPICYVLRHTTGLSVLMISFAVFTADPAVLTQKSQSIGQTLPALSHPDTASGDHSPPSFLHGTYEILDAKKLTVEFHASSRQVLGEMRIGTAGVI